MSIKCNIKDSIDALNHGLDSFEKAFKFTGGKMTVSLKFAMDEIKKEYPDLNFDPKTFTEYTSDIMKEAGIIPKSYKFGKGEKADKSQSDKIKRLAEDIVSGREKSKKQASEKEELSEEERKIKSYVSSKYGKNLSKEEIAELSNQVVGDKSVKEILSEKIILEEERKQIESDIKEQQKLAEKQAKKTEKQLYQSETEEAKQREKSRQQYEKEQQKLAEKVNKIVDKFTGLKKDQKETVASELMNDLLESGMITNKEVLNAIAKATGRPQLTEQVIEASDNLYEAKNKLDKEKQKLSDLIKNKDNIKEKEFKESVEKAQYDIYQEEKNVKEAGLELSRLTPPYSFWFHDNIMAAQLNLMSPKSLWKNLTGTAPDMALRLMGNTVASTLGLGFKAFKKTNPLPFGSKSIGAINAIKSKKVARQTYLATKYGSSEVSGDIPRYNYFDYVNKFRNASDNWSKDEKRKAIFGWISGALSVPSSVISKGLTAPDQHAYSTVYESELNSIAEMLNLKGNDKVAFMAVPDPKYAAYAHKKAMTATYKNDPEIQWIKKGMDALNYDPRKHYIELVSKGMWDKKAKAITSANAVAKVMFAPFVKTPIALTSFAMRYIVPEVNLAKNLLVDFKKEEDANIKNRILAESIGQYVAAVTLRYVAINMVAKGLISIGFGDDDRKAEDVQEQAKGGSSKINVSALFRGITGQGYSSKKNDTWTSLSYMGGTGMILGTYAHMYSRMDEKEKEELANQTPLDPNFYLSSPTAPIAAIRSALENTFLSGTNNAYKAFAEEDEDRMSKLAISLPTLLMTGAYNSTFQEFSKQIDENVKKQYDKDLSFTDNLLNKFGYNFLGGKIGPGMKNKIFSLSENDESSFKKKRTLFFDGYLGRLVASLTGADLESFMSDPESEAYKLNSQALKVAKEDRGPFYPSGVGKIQNIKIKSKNKTETVNIELTPEQHEFLMQKASMSRMFFAAPVINSKEFQESDPEAQTKTLQKAYKKGIEEAKKILIQKYPEIKNQKTQKQVDKEENDESIKEQIKKLEKYIPKKILK